MLFVVLISSAIFISIVNGQAAYCAFDRGVEPANENNAGTYNFLNGEFIRDYSYSSGGQTDLWQGMPYYKMTASDCFVPVLYLYRYISYVSGEEVHWVIGPNMGSKPINGYAYCGPDSGVVVDDLASPVGDCDGNWMIGDPQDSINGQDAAHELDSYFYIRFGGCPQVTCEYLKACSSNNDEWATTVDYDEDSGGGTKCDTYTYVSANVYQADNLNQYYLFFNIKTMRWAFDESISEYDDCELYKNSKGFDFVTNVNAGSSGTGSYALSTADDGGFWWIYFSTSNDARYIRCSGTVDTPSPTTTEAPVPTAEPVSTDPCEAFYGGQLSPSVIPLCWEPWPTAPTVAYSFTGNPSASPIEPTTYSPTVVGATPRPNSPNSSPGSSATPQPTQDSSAYGIVCSIYLISILLAICKLF